MHFVTKYASVYLSIAQKLQSFEYFLNVIITGIFFSCILHIGNTLATSMQTSHEAFVNATFKKEETILIKNSTS